MHMLGWMKRLNLNKFLGEYFSGTRLLDAALQHVQVTVLPLYYPERQELLTGHCVRVGTCSTLLKLSLSEAAVK